MTAPKTGVKALDDVVGGAVNTVTSGVGDLTTGLNRSVNSASDTVRDLVAGAAKNIERNAADTFNGIALAAKGDFRGFDRTLINAATLGMAPPGFLANPDDVNAATGTTTAEQQLTKAAEEEAAAAAAEEAAYAQESAMNDIRSVISGQISARRRAPGRDMTLLSLGGNTNSNTLLTTG